MAYQPTDLADYNLRQTIKHLMTHGIPRDTLAGVLASLAAEFAVAENV